MLLMCALGVTSGFGQQKQPWKGYSILGDGHVTVVYSDDNRITDLTHARGIQHLYFRDYTADYVASTSFDATDRAPADAEPPRVGMKNFFTAQTLTRLADGSERRVLCWVHPAGAVVLALKQTPAAAGRTFRFVAQLRREIRTDIVVSLESLRVEDGVATAVWSNGTVLEIGGRNPQDRISVNGDSIEVSGVLPADTAEASVVIAPAASAEEARSKIRALREDRDPEITASQYWNAWISHGVLPRFGEDTPEAAAWLELYKRNLYCVKAATLNGQIPADITGQFVTNGMPQLYPRDAMMCARVLLLTGHPDEARQVIEFWASPQVAMKTPGEWYARYDAHARAVDSGSGARFDEPEWDSNGYFIYLVAKYHQMHGVWLANRELIWKLADFLVAHIRENGLLWEGGIVEWSGYLPATNMICSAALKTAAAIARDSGDAARTLKYAAASERIAASLPQMFDPSRQTYADVRFTGTKGANGESLGGDTGEKTYLWDTTANIGVIWGYPDHREMVLSNRFYDRNTIRLGGGMQYFDSPDAGLAGYGHGVFFFTTAAAAEYRALRGDKAAAGLFVEWMTRNANSYGLMPERILPDGSDCSPASPLSWCSAEFAEALLLFSQLP